MVKLKKYPQNILFLLIFLFLCIGIVLFIIEYDSISFNREKTKNFGNNFSSQITFKLKNNIILGSKAKPLAVQELNGDGSFYLNLRNGNIKVKSIEILGKNFKINKINKTVKILSIKLDPLSQSTGTINLDTGKIDLTVGLMLEMNIDKNPKTEKISILFPLIGKLNKNNGKLDLKGEVTLPLSKLYGPMPVEISISGLAAEV